MIIDYTSIIGKAKLLYSEVKTYHAVIIKRDFFPGTGDYEDPDIVQNDRICECYLVLYEDLVKPDNLDASNVEVSNNTLFHDPLTALLDIARTYVAHPLYPSNT